MTENSYRGVLADWKVKLIRERARRLRVPKTDLPDIEQEVATVLVETEFDEERSNGASERTFVTEVIDRTIAGFRRSDRRYRSRVSEEGESGLPDVVDPKDELTQLDVVSDVQRALAEMDDRQRTICTLLADGSSVAGIARELGCDWHTARRDVRAIRDTFRRLGVDEWLRGSAHTEKPRSTNETESSHLLIDARSAAAMCGRSERTWRTWDAGGLIPQPVRIGRSTMWRIDELKAWTAAGCPRRSDWEVLRKSEA